MCLLLFTVHDVDEFRFATLVWGSCMRRYKRGGRFSHSWLFCPNQGCQDGNILLAGTPPSRPPALSCSNSQATNADRCRPNKPLLCKGHCEKATALPTFLVVDTAGAMQDAILGLATTTVMGAAVLIILSNAKRLQYPHVLMAGLMALLSTYEREFYD